MFHFLRLALPGQSAKQALENGQDVPRTPIYDAPDVECPSSNGLVNRHAPPFTESFCAVPVPVIDQCLALNACHHHTQHCISSPAVSPGIFPMRLLFSYMTMHTIGCTLKLPWKRRSSSRSSSPVGSKVAEAYRLPMSPRASDKLLAHGSSRSGLSSTAGHPPGRLSH